MKQLIDHIYMGVRLGGMFFLSPAAALLISTILCLRVSFSSTDIFTYVCLTYLFFCIFSPSSLVLQGVPSLPLAALG